MYENFAKQNQNKLESDTSSGHSGVFNVGNQEFRHLHERLPEFLRRLRWV